MLLTMKPKFTLGEEVHVMGVINVSSWVADRIYDPHCRREGESGYRYKVDGSPVWFYESQLETPDEIKARIADPEDDEPEYQYDGDTGKAFINGHWQVVSSLTWERY